MNLTLSAKTRLLSQNFNEIFFFSSATYYRTLDEFSMTGILVTLLRDCQNETLSSIHS